jgi:hypothetical protein
MVTTGCGVSVLAPAEAAVKLPPGDGCKPQIMVFGRLLGWVLLILGLVVLCRDVIGWLDTHRFEPEVLGQLWADLSRSSLNATEAMIRRFLSPRLWDPVISTLLEAWASLTLGLLGLTLLVLARRRDRLPERWRR